MNYWLLQTTSHPHSIEDVLTTIYTISDQLTHALALLTLSLSLSLHLCLFYPLILADHASNHPSEDTKWNTIIWPIRCSSHRMCWLILRWICVMHESQTITFQHSHRYLITVCENSSKILSVMSFVEQKRYELFDENHKIHLSISIHGDFGMQFSESSTTTVFPISLFVKWNQINNHRQKAKARMRSKERGRAM